MACLEHSCRTCSHDWCDNDPSYVCPRCGSTDSMRVFDELPIEATDEEAWEE